MPFNGDFYTQDEGKAPSHDFYTQNMQNKGVLPGSWQMRQAYANGSGGTEGSNPNSPSFQTSYSRNVGDRLGGNTSTYNARGVTGTTSVPSSGESYNSQRYGKTGSSEEETIRRVVGTVGKKAKEKKSKEKNPGTGSPGDQGSDDDMAIGSNNTNSQKFGKNARQSGNQSGGANIQAGGDIDFGKSVGAGATQTGTGVQQIGGHGSRQTNNQFMFDPNHPAWSGGGGETPKEKKPPKEKGTPKDKPPTVKKTPKPTPDNETGGPDTGATPPGNPTNPPQIPGGMFHVPPNKKAPPYPTGRSTPQPDEIRPGGMPHGMPRPQGPSWVTGGNTSTTVGNTPAVPDGSTPAVPSQGGMPHGMPNPKAPSPEYLRARKTGVPTGTGSPDAIEATYTDTPTTGLPETTGQTPTTGAPPTVDNSTGAPKGPGFFGRMWNKAADRVMTAPGGGPINFNGNTYTRPQDEAQKEQWQNADSRGLPAGPTSMGEIGTGAPTPMGEIGPGPRAIGPGSRVMGEIGAGDSPASAPIQQVNPRGTYGHPMNGAFGGRGPTRGAPKTTRFGDMGMGVPMQGSVPNGGMPPQYEGMGEDYDATGTGSTPPQIAPSRHPIPGGPREPYVGPSRHPRPPLPAGSTPYVGPSRHPRPGDPYPSQGVEASRRFGVESDDYGRPQEYNY